MRDILHKLLVLCGAVLVVLRLFPSDPGGWISKLFYDDVINVRIEAMTMQLISFLGFTSTAYQQFASNLSSLAHAFALLLQAVVIAFVFFILTRWI
ncbi:MAG TPA: hypothetical protein VKF36_14060 [Syntrophorhabdales bacterium]|nr:hypothetical protein [Syntrophorhabdales bacterium]